MLFSDDAATLECKYAAQQWLQSEDPLIRDFGARLQSILASKKMQEWTFIIHDLFIMNQHIICYIIYYIYIYITYIYIYPVGEGKVCKRNGTSYLRIIFCGAVWVPVPETFSIYSLFLPASLCLVHKEYSNFL